VTLLEIRDLTLAYGVNRVVRGASFAVEEGTAYAILGPNGAGKTSILRAVSGLMPVAAGDIVYRGESLVGRPPHQIVLGGISHVPEGRKIFPEMSVLDNLLVGAHVHGRDAKLVRSLLDRNFELFPALRQRATSSGGALSGGQQQQLTIARGLMADPKLLIVDEPTLGLAPAVISAVAETFSALLRLGLTIVIAEQNADFALRIASRGVVLSGGEVSFEGEVKALRSSAQIRRAYLGG
jgi:branched-chain amino acid transport system ATP-binding protein